MGDIPPGWDRNHFNEGRIKQLIDRAFRQQIHSKGLSMTNAVVQEKLQQIWGQYAFIRSNEEQAGRFIQNPGGLLWRLLIKGAAELEGAEKRLSVPDMYDIG